MLKAKCQSVTGNTRHYIGTVQDRQIIRQNPIDDPDYVTIVEGDNGYYLFRYNATGKCLSDSWFEALDQAKQQAEFEFAIHASQWEYIE